MPRALNTDIAELCRHGLGQLFFVFFPFPDTILSAREGDHVLILFISQWADEHQETKILLQLFFYYSSYRTWEEICQHKDKLQGRTVQVTLFLLLLFLFSSRGTGRGHNCLSGRDFISYKCSFQVPHLRKASLHKTAL